MGAIVTDCHNFEVVVSFWRDALVYVPREPGRDDWIVLSDPEGKGPNLSFQRYEGITE